jgi:hypothetical protein
LCSDQVSLHVSDLQRFYERAILSLRKASGGNQQHYRSQGSRPLSSQESAPNM